MALGAAFGGSVILPVATAAATTWCGYSYWRGTQSEGWRETEAEVEGLSLFRWSGTRLGVTDLRYSYVVDGSKHTGTRVRVGHPYTKWEPIPWVEGRGEWEPFPQFDLTLFVQGQQNNRVFLADC